MVMLVTQKLTPPEPKPEPVVPRVEPIPVAKPEPVKTQDKKSPPPAKLLATPETLKPAESPVTPAVTAPVAQAPVSLPVASNNPTPAPNAPMGAPEPQVPATVATAKAAMPQAPVTPTAARASEFSGVGKAAEAMTEVIPKLSNISKTLGETGSAILRVLVSKTGAVLKVEVAKSSGFPRLDKAFVDAERQNKYLPSICDGKPVTSWYSKPYRVSDSEDQTPSAKGATEIDCAKLPAQD